MRTTIHTMQNNFKLDAEQLGNYEAMSKTELANGYCDADEAGDEVMKSAYFSALMLRYWYKIWAWQKESASLHSAPTDFVDWLVDSLVIAFTYRTWRYEYKPKVSLKNNGAFEGWELDENGNKIPNPYYYKVDPDAPDKIINRCCFSTRGREYQYHNKDMRKANVNTTSLDSLIDENGDYAVKWTGCVTNNSHEYDNPTYLLVNAFTSRNELLEGLVVDGMTNGDAFKTVKVTYMSEVYDDVLGDYVEKEFEKNKYVFDPRKLVKHLNRIDEKYILEYCAQYDLNYNLIGTKLYEKLKKLNNKKLYDLIKKVQLEVRKSDELTDMAKVSPSVAE